MNFLDALANTKAMALAMVVWIVALILVGGAALEMKLRADDRTRVDLVTGARPSKLIVNQGNVDSAEYTNIADMLKVIYPNLEITAGDSRSGSASSITIVGKDVSDYFSFIFSMYDVMSSIPNARWSAKEMCTGERCGNGNVFRVVLTAETKSVSLQQ